MAATRPSARLLEAVQHAGVKTIAIGDPGQLASVQAGGWLGVVGRALGAQRLMEVMRQRATPGSAGRSARCTTGTHSATSTGPSTTSGSRR